MKFAAIIIGVVSAIRVQESPDCPESTQVFSYNERAASSAGLHQTTALAQTACQSFGVAGVNCLPGNSALFATGMNGDEDLGQDIIMKGDKFHYNQKLVQFATGMNGDEDLGQDITMKGDKFHYNQN